MLMGVVPKVIGENKLCVVNSIEVEIESDNRLDTPEKVDKWLSKMSYNQLIGIVMIWDQILNATPNIFFPDVVAILVDRDLHVTQKDSKEFGTIDIAGRLNYNFYFPSFIIKDWMPKKKGPSLVPYLVVGGIGVTCGIFLAALIK